MTDDQIAKLAQGFWQRKTLEEVAQETVSFTFDVMGFARALLEAQQSAPAPSEPAMAGYVLQNPQGEIKGFYWEEGHATRQRHMHPMTYGDCTVQPVYTLKDVPAPTERQPKLCASCSTWGECGSSGKCRHGYFEQ